MYKPRIFLALLLFILPGLLAAQGVTTSAFNGVVTDSEGNGLAGATVVAIHNPTGTLFTATTRADGRFNIPGVKVGGPYTVQAVMEGFKKMELKDIYLKLGEDRQVRFRLPLETIQEAVEVTAPNPIISESRTGAAQNVSTAVIESMPSISRSFDDFARIAPQVDTRGGGAFSAAGRNNRYNSIQIDGAVNNDLFGLAASGTPGGQAGTTPISLDAIQEFQLVLAPYDVRQGGFTGSGLNAITRSGTNTFHGSAFIYGRNQGLVGKGPDQTPYGAFSEYQYGFRLGGPILKDKLFFFLNGEMDNRKNPADWVINDSGSSSDFGGASVSTADAQRFQDILKNTYNHDAGPFGTGRYNRRTESGKIFFRMDYNINSKNRLTVRNNYVNGLADVLGASSATFYSNDNAYTFKSITNSSVVQLNSTLGKNLFNELTLNYTTVREKRDIDTANIFPQVNVNVNGYYLQAGTEQYSAANGLNQDITEITDNLTFYEGKHTIVVGTHNEIFQFANLYIRDYYGTWQFTSLDNFENGIASSYAHSYSNVPGQPNWAAKFRVYQLGAYVGDTWQLRKNLNLTLGLRVDVPIIPSTPSDNPLVAQTYGIRTNQVATGNMLYSPRLGFNWDVTNDKKTQVRGGVGLFSGRTPYVWISNQFGNTGNEFTRLDIRSGVPAFVSDPLNQPTGFTGSINEIDLIDKNFNYPQLLRADLAIDRQLPFGIIGTLEGIYSRNTWDILYQNLNLKPQTNPDGSQKTLYDGRPLFSRNVSTLFNDVIYLTNTTQGYQYSVSAQLQKVFSGGSWINASYTYGTAKDVNSGTSSQASSNFAYNPIGADPNNPELTYSNYDVRHRLGVGGTYVLRLLRKAPTTISAFYGARSGRPYSTTYSNTDVNGDGARGNDLIFVPASQSDVIMVNSSGVPLADQAAAWAQLDDFIKGDPALDAARGTIIKRNASREPWYHTMDLRFMQDIPVPGLNGHKLELTLDIINLLNLIDHNWGVLNYVSNQNDVPLAYKGIDIPTGKPKIQFIPRTSRFAISQLYSRYQIQLGVRYAF